MRRWLRLIQPPHTNEQTRKRHSRGWNPASPDRGSGQWTTRVRSNAQPAPPRRRTRQRRTRSPTSTRRRSTPDPCVSCGQTNCRRARERSAIPRRPCRHPLDRMRCRRADPSAWASAESTIASRSSVPPTRIRGRSSRGSRRRCTSEPTDSTPEPAHCSLRPMDGRFGSPTTACRPNAPRGAADAQRHRGTTPPPYTQPSTHTPPSRAAQ